LIASGTFGNQPNAVKLGESSPIALEPTAGQSHHRDRRLRGVIGVDSMMWGSDYPHGESTFPLSRRILTEILAGVPDHEQAKIVGGNTARVYNFDMTRLTVPV
jgi:hypothetical protein